MSTSRKRAAKSASTSTAKRPQAANQDDEITWRSHRLGLQLPAGGGQSDAASNLDASDLAKDGTGCIVSVVWPAAEALCDFFAAHTQWLVSHSSALELGSGVGAPGLLAARLGCENIVLTDYHKLALATLRASARRNKLDERCSVMALDWNDPLILGAPVDSRKQWPLIFGADLAVSSSAATILANAVKLLLGGAKMVAPNGGDDDSGGVFLYAHTQRCAVYRAADGSIQRESGDSALSALHDALVGGGGGDVAAAQASGSSAAADDASGGDAASASQWACRVLQGSWLQASSTEEPILILAFGSRSRLATLLTTASSKAAAASASGIASGGGGGGAAPSSADVAAALSAAYADIDGYRIAREAKAEQRSNGVYLEGIQYGEIDPTSFATALSWCAPIRQGKEQFIDLGSGSGKAVLTAACSYPFASCMGVEILRPLHAVAERALARCRSQMVNRHNHADNETTSSSSACCCLRCDTVKFVCGDALAHDWCSADVVFVSLTCFTDEQIEAVRMGAERLRKGARLLATTKPLETPALKLLRKEALPYGKGTLTFRAYERV